MVKKYFDKCGRASIKTQHHLWLDRVPSLAKSSRYQKWQNMPSQILRMVALAGVQHLCWRSTWDFELLFSLIAIYSHCSLPSQILCHKTNTRSLRVASAHNFILIQASSSEWLTKEGNRQRIFKSTNFWGMGLTYQFNTSNKLLGELKMPKSNIHLDTNALIWACRKSFWQSYNSWSGAPGLLGLPGLRAPRWLVGDVQQKWDGLFCRIKFIFQISVLISKCLNLGALVSGWGMCTVVKLYIIALSQPKWIQE